MTVMLFVKEGRQICVWVVFWVFS